MKYKGYYFQLGETTFTFAGSAINDTSKLSHDLRMSIEGRLAALSAGQHKVAIVEQEEPVFEPEYTVDVLMKLGASELG